MAKAQQQRWEKANKRRKLGPRTELKEKHLHEIEGTREEILEAEIKDLLSRASIQGATNEAKSTIELTSSPEVSKDGHQPITLHENIEVEVVQISSTGDGLAYSPNGDHVIVIPFTVQGDTVVCKPYHWDGICATADLIRIVKPSIQRDGVTPKCSYFGTCSGCQFQMLPYDVHLQHKKEVVERAFQHFSDLPTAKIPPVLETMGSPLQYSYRTKLSPHFTLPRKAAKTGEINFVPPIGFNIKGKNSTMDIEHCPIGTDILQEGLKLERAKVAVNIKNYRAGATVLLRESTERQSSSDDFPNRKSNPGLDMASLPISSQLMHRSSGEPYIEQKFPSYTDIKTYVTKETMLSTAYVGHFKFTNTAGSFFQNNDSILEPFTQYIRENCMLPKAEPDAPKIKYLLDAYCGSGLFTVVLSQLFSSALGIDIDRRGIEAARANAAENNISNAGFIEADASDLFADVPFPADQSLVIIDPPRKGASKDFLRQLCVYGPKRVVYVSCNVHTQARDVGMLVRGFNELKASSRYEIESLMGFDFFPQTSHVEGVCVLNRVDKVASEDVVGTQSNSDGDAQRRS